ncbi:TetR/AcrR family transcriptional regulator [Desulfosporosinus lacus]|uniref:Transcriptional regulator, TetR family n=1 Tax=Desulfosporosinus lacus DSM 15449 TaxID=1121420 RepID=A0A1M6H459_9FIRM|nr:TetR/AcrR family transcriptional regulator [Desulfosporosinus lacus]SHJ16932.1 transcriptional regulator, TetR family [Desulfosporosinus lacus DSM 15449]
MVNESYHHENLKSELIKNGLKLLDEEGYENFSMRKVAKACGVSHTAPYRHFRNKDDLIIAITLKAEHKFNSSLQEAINRYPNDIKSQIKEMGYTYVKFFVENPEYLRLLFRSDLKKHLNNENCEILKDKVQPFGTFYNTIVRYQSENQSNDAGSITDLNALVLACWGLVHGIAVLISTKDFVYEGDYLELTRKILWSETFL